MRIIDVERPLIQAITEQLMAPHRRVEANHHRLRAREIAARDWAHLHVMQDAIEDMDFRALEACDPKAWLQLVGTPAQFAYRPPQAGDEQATGSEMARAEEFCALLIFLQGIGFEIDPTPYVEALKPKLSAKHVLSDTELTVLWHKPGKPVEEKISLRSPGNACSTAIVTSSHSRTVTIGLDGDGKGVSLESNPSPAP